MTAVIIPPELEIALAEEAKRQGTTPELLAVESLRRMYAPASEPANNGGTLRDFLQGYIGAISGTSVPLSENTGRRFTDMLTDEGQQQGVDEFVGME
jgi:hypothetical protein